MSRARYESEIGNKVKKAAAMPDASRLHVIARGLQWIVKREGAQRAQRVYNNKKQAVDGAMAQVKSGAASVVIIHKKDGTIEAWKS